MSGLAAVVGGAVSMALGEYVSVSSQRDSERAMGMAEQHQVNPWSAGIASFLSFLLGAALPFITALVAPEAARIVSIFVVTLVALALTGALSAKLGDAPVGRSVARIVIGGSLALAVTFTVGSLFGAICHYPQVAPAATPTLSATPWIQTTWPRLNSAPRRLRDYHALSD